MKKMRRICAAAAALAVLLCALPAFAGDVTIYREGQTDDLYVNYMAYYDSELYLFDYSWSYCVWKNGEGLSEKKEMDCGEYAEPEEGYSTQNGGLVSGDDGLYCMVYTYLEDYDEDDETYSRQLEAAELIKLDKNDEGNLAFSDQRVEMDWDDMLESYDDENEYVRDMQKPFISGTKLVFGTYTDNGSAIGVFDIESGEGEIVELDDSPESFCKYKDGVLIVARDYDNYEDPAKLMYLDLEELETEELGEAPAVEYSNPTNLAYDAEKDTLYYTLNGQLWAMPGLDASAATAVAAVQTDSWSNFPAILTDDGDYICGDYQTVIMRSTDPSQRPEKSLSVYSNYNQYLDNAYYAFTAAHGDVEVVKVSNSGDITQAMMNKSDSVDVYVISTSDNAYSSVFDRGYMAELNGSESISALVNAMYPGLQEAVSKDGNIYAVPVSLYVNNSISYNPKAFEKCGLSEDDVPATMMEFLQLLQRAPELMEENEGMYAFQTYMTADDARWTIFYDIIGTYAMYMRSGDIEMSYDTELLRSLLAEYEKIDFDSMGLLEDYEDSYVMTDESEDSVLFETYSDIGCRTYNVNGSWKPLLLTIDEGLEPIIDSYVDVAFINPFSKNADLAMEYIETAVAEMDQYFLTETCPDVNEPIPNEYYEENLEYYEEQLTSMRAELEKATSEDEKADWQAQITEMEGYRDEYMEDSAWDVTEESIANYREYAKYMSPSRSMGLDGDAGTAYYEQLQQYIEGNITAADMLKNIDDKLRMMLMEDM
jgi:hypothetical protein